MTLFAICDNIFILMNIEKKYIKFMHYSVGSVNQPDSKFEFTICPNDNINDVVNEFQKFLKDIGYEFDGEIKIIQ